MVRRAIKIYSRMCKKKRGSEREGKFAENFAYFIGGAIGDGIMALPAINKLRKAFPGARLDVYTNPAAYEFISFFLHDYTVKCFRKRDIFFFLPRLFCKKYDVSFISIIGVYDIYVEIASYIMSKKAYGFRYRHETIYDRLYYDSLAVEEKKTHDTVQNMNLVSSMLNLDVTEDDYMLKMGRRKTLSDTPRIVLIHPGIKKGYANRAWPIENYSALIDRLKQAGYSVKIILGPDEKDLQTFFSDINKYDILFSPEPEELIKELEKSFMFIGNDSGPAHIADYVGIPVIVLFGPADPGRTAPRGKNTIIIYKKKDCSPCYYTAIECKENICMTDISVEDIWEKVKYIENKA